MTVTRHTAGDVFCLYLWRSLQSPGTVYLANGLHSARAVCAELIAAGYIVKVVQMVTNIEYELRGGALVPCTPLLKPSSRRRVPVRPALSHAGA